MLDQNTHKSYKYFISLLVVLLIFGIVMVFSSSYIYARENFGSSTFFLFKQLIFLFTGLVLAFGFSKTKFSFWYDRAYEINIIAICLLVVTFLPVVGIGIKGSHRWINLYFFNLQPSEIIKYTLILASIKYFDQFENMDRNNRLLYASNLIAPMIVLALQPDFGSFTISFTMIIFSCFLSNFPRKYFYSILAFGFFSIVGIMIAAPYRMKRLFTYLDPWSDPQNSGFQIIQSYLAFANGSLFGSGLGNSNEKLFYLPEAYNDFIFSVIGEELGFIGVLFVVLIFIGFCYNGFKLAMRLEERNRKNFATGIIFLIGLQAFLNMAVVLGLLPTKGLNLPFISYGGSSLIINLIAMGLFTSIVKNNNNSFDSKNYKT